MQLPKITTTVQALNLPAGSYVVMGGSSLALFGLRDSDDIDLLVTPAVFQTLKQQGWPEFDAGTNRHRLSRNKIEIFDHWTMHGHTSDLKTMLKHAVNHHGIPFASLEDTKLWKQANGRPKDLADVKLIDQYLRSHQL